MVCMSMPPPNFDCLDSYERHKEEPVIYCNSDTVLVQVSLIDGYYGMK